MTFSTRTRTFLRQIPGCRSLGPLGNMRRITQESLPEKPRELSWIDNLPRSVKWTQPYLRLARMERPIGTWLLFWPCAWSTGMACYASGAPPSALLGYSGIFLVGSFVMRGAGCTINDLWDRKLDAKVARTQDRPLASGQITPKKALAFLSLQMATGLGVVLTLNWTTIQVAMASLPLVVIYPLMKRITYFPQLVLGMVFTWGSLVGFSAVDGVVNWAVAAPLHLGALFWCLFYDTIYAHMDKVYDVKAGIKSTALYFGSKTKLALGAWALIALGCFAYSGYENMQGIPFYFVSVGGVAAHMIRQIAKVNLDNEASCLRTFKSNKTLGFILFSGIFLDYISRLYENKKAGTLAENPPKQGSQS